MRVTLRREFIPSRMLWGHENPLVSPESTSPAILPPLRSRHWGAASYVPNALFTLTPPLLPLQEDTPANEYQGLPKSGTPPHWPRAPKKRRIAGAGKVVAVSSAKGGVGKSTVACSFHLSLLLLSTPSSYSPLLAAVSLLPDVPGLPWTMADPEMESVMSFSTPRKEVC